MTQTQLGILIGGILPAVLFGISGICQKLSNQHNISLGAYIISVGIGVLAIGIALCIYTPQQSFSTKSIVPAIAMGAIWACGAICIALAISKYKAPLSVLAPLYNANTLVAVIGSLIIFAEWKDANVTKLIIGSILIVAGSVFVSS